MSRDSLWPHGLYPTRLLCPWGVFQARILEWVAIPFSRGSFWPRDWTQISQIADRFLTIWTTREASKKRQQRACSCARFCIHMEQGPCEDTVRRRLSVSQEESLHQELNPEHLDHKISQPPELWENRFLSVKATQFRVFCYGTELAKTLPSFLSQCLLIKPASNC